MPVPSGYQPIIRKPKVLVGGNPPREKGGYDLRAFYRWRIARQEASRD